MCVVAPKMPKMTASSSRGSEWLSRPPIQNRRPLFPSISALVRKSLLSRGARRSCTHQCPQRHQGSDGNVLVVHQMFLRQRQRFHNGSCLVLGLRVDQENDASAI